MIGFLSNDLDAIADTITQYNIDRGLNQEIAMRDALDLAIEIGQKNHGDVYLSVKATAKLCKRVKELKKQNLTIPQIMKKTGLSRWQIQSYDN